MSEVKEYLCKEPQRLDLFLAAQMNQTRSQIAQLIKKNAVHVDDKIVSRPGVKLKADTNIRVILPEVHFEEINENFFSEVPWASKVEVLYEDEDLLVLNKPSGVTVHPAPSVKEATLVDWLKYKNINLSTISGEERHGIVHRLDKGTSGAMVIAKNNESHTFLSEQLQNKSMGRYYLAIITPPLKDDITAVESNIGRSSSNRLKMASGLEHGKYAKTLFKHLMLSKDEKHQLVAAKLFTGRTHQIRVHLESLGRHIVGDHIYAQSPKMEKAERIMLHAYIIYFIHPRTKETLYFQASFDQEMQHYMEKKFDMENMNELLEANNITGSFTNN